MSRVCRHIHTFGFFYLWIVSAACIMRWYTPSESPESTYYADDKPTSVLETVGIMFVEILVLYFLLKPWQRPRSVWGSVIALALFTPWTLLSTVIAMHATTSMLLHALWLWIVEVLLLIYVVYAFDCSQSNSGGQL